MSEELTYLEKQTDAAISYEHGKIEISFHRAKVKLNDQLEIEWLKSINQEIRKEIVRTEDELKIYLSPPKSYHAFHKLYSKSEQAQWQFAYNLVQHIQKHALKRLKIIVCPENILFDYGLNPHFLHYGVSESIPPYEDNDERLWREVRAVIAEIADNKIDFASYVKHHETLDLSPIAKQIMDAETYEQLQSIITHQLQNKEKDEQSVLHVPAKKWKVQRYTLIAVSLLLIPTLFYSLFALFFKIPQTNAYIDSNRSFMEEQYSSVVTTLENYDEASMPYGVKYQLASSYIVNESLTENQKQNVQNTITLQSDERYFSYWINIGRGNYQEAIDTARLLEDRDLIVYGLLKQREALKIDQELSGDEREERLNKIEREIDDYQETMDQVQEGSSGQDEPPIDEEAKSNNGD
ncbi:MAG: type VII secretion protein EssB [Bacillota bacterium]|uniref:Type VII secretion protein EssB n=1 Tax=Virgibacillus salarius TaxID=447199 RepID=A0A941IBB7_9BACI|nr:MULTISPECIES: type VII secretion protein EssB [Bacillaceae]MBR7795090.1 type VII secretion protein EssB [Virgibacillus salarius]NAZ07807.1 type VII secretion protein EssB [Agaribacter marinus]WBX79780.1 type VII secretion protein EssB [Virgibacillus salarius]